MLLNTFKQGADNWGYLLANNKGEAIAVDPLEESHYLKILAEKNLRLVEFVASFPSGFGQK